MNPLKWRRASPLCLSVTSLFPRLHILPNAWMMMAAYLLMAVQNATLTRNGCRVLANGRSSTNLFVQLTLPSPTYRLNNTFSTSQQRETGFRPSLKDDSLGDNGIACLPHPIDHDGHCRCQRSILSDPKASSRYSRPWHPSQRLLLQFQPRLRDLHHWR